MYTLVVLVFHLVLKGASADAGSHYQKLYGRVTNVCGNRRGQPRRSAMQEPHSGRNPFVIRLTSPSGKYDFLNSNISNASSHIILNACGTSLEFDVIPCALITRSYNDYIDRTALFNINSIFSITFIKY